MALDTDKLRTVLKDYRKTVDKHHISLHQDYHEIDGLFRDLFRVYGGQRAEELAANWRRTGEWFDAYLKATSGLQVLLEERILELEHL